MSLYYERFEKEISKSQFLSLSLFLDGKTGKKNEDSPETKKEEEVSKSDEELPRNGK